jgi:hypothetical protein
MSLLIKLVAGLVTLCAPLGINATSEPTETLLKE